MNWSCIFRVHGQHFTKFGHQIASRDTKHMHKSNDIDKTSNDRDLRIFIISGIWSKLLPPKNMTLKITPTYYLGHHSVVYTFKKSAQKKQLNAFSMNDAMKYKVAFLMTKPAPLRRPKPHY